MNAAPPRSTRLPSRHLKCFFFLNSRRSQLNSLKKIKTLIIPRKVVPPPLIRQSQSSPRALGAGRPRWRRCPRRRPACPRPWTPWSACPSRPRALRWRGWQRRLWSWLAAPSAVLRLSEGCRGSKKKKKIHQSHLLSTKQSLCIMFDLVNGFDICRSLTYCL